MNGFAFREMPVRLLIVDDHELVRQGLRAVVLGGGIEIVAEAANGESAIRQVQEYELDVVLLDIGLPDRNGFDVLMQIKREKPALPVLVYSVHDKAHYAERSLSLGAAGYLVKGEGNAELLTAIRAACDSRRVRSEPCEPSTTP